MKSQQGYAGFISAARAPAMTVKCERIINKYVTSLNNTSMILLLIVFFLGIPVAALAETPVNLGTAGNFVILTKAGISTTGATKIVGNIGVSPIASNAITGFALILDKSRKFATSHLVTGKVYAASYATPTPSMLTTAIGNMQTAYTNAAGRTNPTKVNLGAGNIGGLTIKPGLYKWGTGVLIPTNVTLSGGPNAVWIMQISGTLKISAGKMIILSHGAQAKNIFWQVAGETTIGTTAVFNGNILDKTGIAIKTGAKLNGRALAQTAVTLEANSIVLHASAAIGADAVENSQRRILPESIGSHCFASACSALSP
jgi:hypothetical protein